MTKKRDDDLKMQNRSDTSQPADPIFSDADVQNFGVDDEGDDAGDESNPVTAEMLKSREHAVRANQQKEKLSILKSQKS